MVVIDGDMCRPRFELDGIYFDPLEPKTVPVVTGCERPSVASMPPIVAKTLSPKAPPIVVKKPTASNEERLALPVGGKKKVAKHQNLLMIVLHR